MLHSFKNALITYLFLILFCCGLYPFIIWILGQLFFPHQANGSLILINHKIVGSQLIGQNFTRPEYFWGRKSAAGAGYDGAASSGSNLGPTSKTLRDRLQADALAYLPKGSSIYKIPAELLTSSASGLDPHLSPSALKFQIPRVSAARGVNSVVLQNLIDELTISPVLGGVPVVSVFTLNQELNKRFAASTRF